MSFDFHHIPKLSIGFKTYHMEVEFIAKKRDMIS